MYVGELKHVNVILDRKFYSLNFYTNLGFGTIGFEIFCKKISEKVEGSRRHEFVYILQKERE